ncbi:MAG: MBL fold metallo-hydrolase [Gammaproteobacteria bacterium]|nr:MBL fold metallo-hydrolase [Gammaproteobacteria bacterium]MBU1655592.1 MBL fold metallo-hydrolase [Gammaproteobacteria bacterium]MBU1961873.1 MBL fold metallo-hydrolase [Gammaproteobacteria bacterium]
MKLVIIPVTPLQQNCSLLICEASGKAVLVDPGGDVERLKAAVATHRAQPERLLITHGHFDHAGAAAELAEFWDIPIEGPQIGDEFLLDSIPQWCRQFGHPLGRSFLPDRWLADLDEVTFGEERLKIRHCPGHTPGHVIFFHAEEKLACVGDVLFKGSIGRTDLPGGSYSQLLDSIRDRLFPLGDLVRFVPGHGPMSTFGEERRNNPFIR